MKHRHLAHEEFTIAAIEDILARGRMPDWVPLITAIQADPYGDVAEKTNELCKRPFVWRTSFSSCARYCEAGASISEGLADPNPFLYYRDSGKSFVDSP